MKTKPLIFINMFLFFSVVVVFFKIFSFASIENLIMSKIIGHPYCKDCNVILISLDTLSANHLPCYGYERNTAPNLCKFGKDNIMFKNMYSNASWTLPSHVSIFTGLYPSLHNVNNPNKDYLKSTIPFLPEILQENNYKTYFFMKSGIPLPMDLVYNRGIDMHREVTHPKDWNEGLNLLLQNVNTRQKTFLFLHTNWVHGPYFLENQNRKLFTENDKTFANLPTTNEQLNSCSDFFITYLEKALKKDLDNHFWDDQNHIIYEMIYQKIIESKQISQEAVRSICYQYFSELTSYKDHSFQERIDTNNTDQIAHLINSYDSKIKELDEYIQNVIDFVMESKLKNNTIILITADHGEEFMEHGSVGHGSNLYDTTTKVPLMMYIPGQKNIEINRLVQSVDIVPTLLKIMGINKNYTFSGKNVFFGSPELIPENRYITSQELSFGHQLYIVRNNRWKLHYKKNKNRLIPLELYDMSKDPQEKNNLIFTNNGVVEEMLKNVPK